MTGGQTVAAWLRIVSDPAPAAYYACRLCPYTAHAKPTGRGRAATVAAFAAAIRTDHRANCPGLHERTSTA